MGMKFSMVGETLRGFSIAREKGIYGEIEMKVDPKTLSEHVCYKSYSYTTRYLYSIPLLIFLP